MPLAFEEYGDALGAACTVLRAQAGSAGLEAAVPTCPGWSVADLVVHQGMVHRWATDLIAGRQGDGAPAHEAAGRASSDLLGWFDEGANALLQALADAPADLDAPIFLPDAPAPRLAWARRQAHETTIHAVDAIAARLGTAPAPDQVWFSAALAVDGIDEMLTGFAVRPTVPLRSPAPRTVRVAPSDQSQTWTVHIGPSGAATSRGGQEDDADCTIGVTAREAYLGLWNRGPLPGTGPAELLDLWRTSVQVRWSR